MPCSGCEFLSPNQLALDVYLPDVPIVPTEQEPLQRALENLFLRLPARRGHAKFHIPIYAPYSRISGIACHAGNERVERFSGHKRAGSRGDVADIGAALSRQIQQSGYGQLTRREGRGRGRGRQRVVHRYDLGRDAGVLNGCQNRG